MRWATAIATSSHLKDAIEEASEKLATDLQAPPDLVFAFVSATYSDHIAFLPECLRSNFPTATLFGCSAEGVIQAQTEIESQDALVLIGATLPDVKITSFTLGPEPEEWTSSVDVDEAASIVVLADQFSCNPNKLTSWLDKHFPDSTKIGGVASGGKSAGDTILLLDQTLHRTGAIVLVLEGNIKTETLISQSCKPIGQPMFITRSEGPILHDLDGQSAMWTIEKLFTTLDEKERKLARSSLFLGIGIQNEKGIYEDGDFIIRGIVGIDPENMSIAVASELPEGSVVQFHLRDSETAEEQLNTLLSKHSTNQHTGALLFSCTGRGQNLYGSPNHETLLFQEKMGDLPLGGIFGNGEIGPVKGQTYVHSYTSAFGLFRPKTK